MIVSNHGGRQLDGVPASLRMLPEVLAAVDGRIEVLMDGGIRRGSDIVKALCLGARAVLIGRAYAYGLAAAGHAGVARAIDILRTDMIRTMKLLGCASVSAAWPRVPSRAARQIPSSKSQIPTTPNAIPRSTPKLQRPISGSERGLRMVGIWNLGVRLGIWALGVVGAWDLELGI